MLYSFPVIKEVLMNIERVDQFRWVLLELIIDLGSVSKFYSECYDTNDFDPSKNKYHLGKIRMCHMSAIVALSKLAEALSGYASELKACCSGELVSKTWQYKKVIEDKKIYEFRSKYAAHVFDKDTNKPLDLQGGSDRLIKIVGSTPEELQSFYSWINSVKESKDDLLNHLTEIHYNLVSQLDRSFNNKQRT
jgi:hypothetical protein